MSLWVVATLLQRGSQLERFSDGLTLLALAYGMAPMLGVTVHPLATLACAVLTALGVLHKYWAIRVGLDAAMFAHLANSHDLAADTLALDRALIELSLKPQAPDHRNWPERSKAALALLRRQGVCLALQIMVALATLLILPFNG